MTPSPHAMRKLMESGLSSAYAIASISEKRFMKMYGDALGGE